MKFFKFLKKKSTLLDLAFIVGLLFVIFLRFYRFDQTYHWTGDNVRDFLVAEHIVKYHDFKWIAPWAAGSENHLVGSVFYYYFIALIYFFSFGQVFYFQLFVAILTLVIETTYAYFFSKLLFKERIIRYGLVLLFCLIPVVGLYSRSVYQPYLVIPFLMMSFYYFSSAFVKKSNKSLSLAIIFYFICLNLHISVFIIFPWFLFLVLYLQYFIYSKKLEKFNFKKFLFSQINYNWLIVIAGLLFLVINQLVIDGLSKGSFSFYEFLQQILTASHFYIGNFFKSFSVPFISFISQSGVNLLSIIFYSLVLIVFVLFFMEKKTFYSITFFSIFLFFPFVFLVAKNDYNYHVPDNYFVVFYLAFPFFFSSILHALDDKLIRNCLLVSFLILFSIFSIKQSNSLNKFYSNKGLIDKYKVSALAISKDASSNLQEKDDFFVFVLNDQANWSPSIYWYYLEQIYKTRLSENANLDCSIAPLRKTSRTFYLICDNPRIPSEEGKDRRCVERLFNKGIVNSYKKIFTESRINLSIYRITLYEDFPNDGLYGLVMGNF